MSFYSGTFNTTPVLWLLALWYYQIFIVKRTIRMIDFDLYKEETITLVAHRIKALRLYKGYTNNEQFAFTHNIARSQYGRYERGSDMMLSSLLKVLYAHQISIMDFFSEDFDEKLLRGEL